MSQQKLYTVEEAAGVLGMHHSTVRRHIKEGRLKASKFGRRSIRISSEDLSSFYREQGGGELGTASEEAKS
jgi:excisionase family DNA binding protein